MIVDGHNDLVLHRLARRADDAHGSRRGSRRRLRRRVLRALRAVAAVPRPDRDPVRGAAARSDPARGGRAHRRGAVRRALRAAGAAGDRCGRVPRGGGLGDRPHGGRGADRARPLEPRVVVRAGPPVDRADLVSAERVRGGRAVPVPVLVGHGRRADRGRAGARCGVQQTRDPRRPVAPQLGGLLGRRAALRRAARRDAFERARALRRVAQPDGRTARGDPRLGRRRRRQLRGLVSSARTATRCRRRR